MFFPGCFYANGECYTTCLPPLVRAITGLAYCPPGAGFTRLSAQDGSIAQSLACMSLDTPAAWVPGMNDLAS